MDARLLDPSLRYKTEQFSMPTAPAADAGPTMPALNDPEAYQVRSDGPIGAQALTQQAQEVPPVAAAASPAQAIAQPAGGTTASRWTAERKAFADRANQAGRAYRQAVDARRAKRKHLSEYNKIHSQLEASASSLADLKSMQDNYKDVYTPDSPATMALTKRQIMHFQKVQRLREQLVQKAQHLNKTFGMPLNKSGVIDDVGDDDGDEEFDAQMKEGYMDALMAEPPQ